MIAESCSRSPQGFATSALRAEPVEVAPQKLFNVSGLSKVLALTAACAKVGIRAGAITNCNITIFNVSPAYRS